MDGYGVITPLPLSSDEVFEHAGETTLARSTIKDFWQWAYSDLVGNTDRGTLAEYIVAKAIGDERKTRNSWESFDLTAFDGTKVEVKSASFVQSWHQNQLTRVQFLIKKTQEWDPRTNTFIPPAKRHADVYVFCLLSETVKINLNPLDINQWEFYVLGTREIDRDFGDRQSISLNQVRGRSRTYTINELADAVSSIRLI
tara:strand:- start:266 stop:862 length:597 start_codon:yes stop_codon:yes gene_type:complete